jgi:putative membrane protein
MLAPIKKKFRFPKLVANFQNRERIILRDFLALERTTLANERTLFAYIRVSLFMVLAGITFVQLEAFESVVWAGYLSFFLSVVLLIFGFIRFQVLRNRLRQFYNAIDFAKDDLEKEE